MWEVVPMIQAGIYQFNLRKPLYLPKGANIYLIHESDTETFAVAALLLGREMG